MVSELKPVAIHLSSQCLIERLTNPPFADRIHTASLHAEAATCIAQLEARCERMARADKAVADLREIATRICNLPESVLLEAGRDLRLAATLARPYCQVETDPLVEALEATGDDEAIERAGRLRAQLLDRGYEIAKRGVAHEQIEDGKLGANDGTD